MKQILIAEDEERIAAFLEKGLKAAGFATTVAKNGAEAVIAVFDGNFDLLILDLGLPQKNGWTVLEELRGQGQNLPILILSAYDEIKDKVALLDGGANDYISKPFSFQELLARIRVQLRNNNCAPARSEEMLLSVGDIVLNLLTREIKVGDRLVELSAKEFAILETFLRAPKRIMTREQLLDRVWGYNHEPGSNVVDVYVGYLRKKLGSDRIETVRGVGYRLKQQPPG